jgi:hypothetical protein
MNNNLLLNLSNSPFKNLIQIWTGLTLFHNQKVCNDLFALCNLFYFKPIPFEIILQSQYVSRSISINAQTGVPP